MERWKINLLVLCFGQFLVMAGMTMILPFLPFYLLELGLSDPEQIAKWTGLIFAANFLSAFLFQPLWGSLADRYGSKIMLLRSGFGMALVMTLMGFATSAWMLLILRFINGIVAGFNPAATSLISTHTPQEKMGFAMGTFQSGGVAGMIMGPLLGGILAEWIGYRYIFYVTGSLLFLAACLTWALVKENKSNYRTTSKENPSILSSFRLMTQSKQLLVLFSITFAIQFSLLFTMPIIPLLVTELHGTGPGLAFFTGLVVSITGFSNMLASPWIGRFADRVGAERILLVCLVGVGIMFLPHFWVHTMTELFIVRFLLGVCIGGLLPMVNSLIGRYSPQGMKSLAYGFNSSALSLGNMLGPIIGGMIYGLFSIREMFLVAASLMLLNAGWTYVRLRKRDEGQVG
jgi:DHA1 family multidrug resistance protein-like MFS transporter